MAGAFGYGADTYQASMDMANYRYCRPSGARMRRR